jgi:hypothetical protein
MSTKTCSKCGVEKDVGEFYKRKNRKEGKDGLQDVGVNYALVHNLKNIENSIQN